MGPLLITITRDQNPSGASNRRHKQLQNDRKRQRKEEQRRQLQTQQHSNTSQLTEPSVHCEADSLELVDHPLVSTSLRPLTNLVPTPEDNNSIVTRHRLVFHEEDAQLVASSTQSTHSTHSIDESTVDQESDFELELAVDVNDNLCSPSPPRRRLRSVAIVPEGSSLSINRLSPRLSLQRPAKRQRKERH